MEEILKIKRDSNFYLQGNLISTNGVGDINDYLVQLLGYYTTIEEGITVSELIHAFYGMRKFIKDYFSEDYEITRAFATATKLIDLHKEIKLHKSFRIESDDFLDEDEYIYILPEISFIKAEIGENAYLKLGDIPVVIDEKISFIGEEFSFNKKSKFTLLDLLCCLFEEMPEYVKEGEGIAY